MSKRSNRQLQRRQVRRALKAAGDTIQRVGSHRVMGYGYGTGLTASQVRCEIKNTRMNDTKYEEFFY